MKEIFRGFASSIHLLTNLPCPGRDTERIDLIRPWFPFVGLLLGGVIAIVGQSLTIVFPGWNEIAAFIMVVLSAWITRGFHLDGISDWADGFWGGFTKEKVLAIMKDSCVGAFGSIALILTILGKWIVFTRLLAQGQWRWLIAAFVISRTMQVVLAGTQPYARAEGGTGGSFVSNTTPRDIWPCLIIMSIILIVVVGIHICTFIIPFLAVIVTLLFGAWSRRRIDGITGDLLGAVNELIELLVLILAAGIVRGAA